MFRAHGKQNGLARPAALRFLVPVSGAFPQSQSSPCVLGADALLVSIDSLGSLPPVADSPLGWRFPRSPLRRRAVVIAPAFASRDGSVLRRSGAVLPVQFPAGCSSVRRWRRSGSGPVLAKARKSRGGFPLRLRSWLISSGSCSRCPRAESCCRCFHSRR